MSWRNMPGHFDWDDVYTNFVNEAKDGATIVQVGRNAKAAMFMCETIDTRAVDKKLDFFVLESAHKPFGLESVDFAYLLDPISQLQEWLPLMKPGGVIAGWAWAWRTHNFERGQQLLGVPERDYTMWRNSWVKRIKDISAQ